MKLPNKVIKYNESILSKLTPLLSLLEKKSYTTIELYKAFKNNVDDVSDFLDILDCLFALKKISYNEVTGRISYVV